MFSFCLLSYRPGGFEARLFYKIVLKNLFNDEIFDLLFMK